MAKRLKIPTLQSLGRANDLLFRYEIYKNIYIIELYRITSFS